MDQITKFKQKKYLALFVLAIALLFFLVPQHNALAACPLSPTDCMIGLINWYNEAQLQVLGTILVWSAKALEAFVKPETQAIITNTSVVETGWTLMRNFVNLFFILILIIMAFGTIFDNPKYKFSALLPSFLIAAVLVNFSLAIGEYIVSISNGLAAVFLREISNFSQVIADGFAAGKLIPSEQTFTGAAMANITNGSYKLLVNAIFGSVFLIIAVLAFLTAFIFALVRIPVLWVLLMVSPVALLGYALPNLRAKTWGTWWNMFYCWCFFLPFYIFFLMFAIIFLRNKIALSATLPAADSFFSTFVGPGSAFSDLLFYVLTMIFMFGGLWYSRKMACAAGSGVGKVFSTIESGVRKYTPGAGYVRSLYGGAKEGLAAKGKEFGEKGVPIPGTAFRFGGAREERLRTARMAEEFGFGANVGVADKTRAVEIDKEMKAIRELGLTNAELNARMSTAKNPIERAAAFRLRAESGWLDSTDQVLSIDLIRALGGSRTGSGAALMNSIKKGSFERMFSSPAEKETFVRSAALNTPELIEFKKMLLLDMAQNRELFDEALIKQTLDLYKSDTIEIRKKVTEALKKNISNIAYGKSTTEKEALLSRLGTIDSDLQREFATSMAESKEIMSESMAISILDMFKDESTESKKKIEEALKDSISNFAKDKTSREALVTTSTDVRIRRAAAKAMIDKKEIDSWKMRREIIGLYGGIDPTNGEARTIEGRQLAKDISESNILFKEEAEYRKDHPAPATSHALDLNTTQRTELHEQILSNIENGAITNFSTEELKTPEVFNALYYGVRSGRIPIDKFDRLAGLKTGGKKGGGKPDRKKREAGVKIADAAFRGGSPIPY